MPIQRSRNNLNNLYSAMNNVSSAINRHRDDDKKKTYEVEGLFKPLMKNGKFTVVMRFLPAKVGDGDEIPWVENRIHLFQLENGQCIYISIQPFCVFSLEHSPFTFKVIIDRCVLIVGLFCSFAFFLVVLFFLFWSLPL